MNRRHFLSSFRQHPTDAAESQQVLSGLEPYSGTWAAPQVAQLLRRTTFSGRKADLQQFLSLGCTASVDMLLSVQAAPAPPVNNYSTVDTPDPDAEMGQTWVDAPFNNLYNSPRRASFKSWWIQQMVRQPLNITEKMTLFWHNHLATEASSIGIAQFVYRNNALLRQHALGNFKTMVRQVTTDSGMLRYLNGDQNSKNAPDENYARELQELFTVGKGPDAAFTEADVQAAARVLTGWRNNMADLSSGSYFDPNRHDINNKQFSDFYGNVLITGQTGTNGATETDQLIDMIFAQDEVAKFVCRKLYRFFVYYQISPQVETDVIVPLADIFRNNNYEILPVLNALFKSQHFYDASLLSCYIKNPMDFVVGLCRELGISLPPATDYVASYKAYQRINVNTTPMQMNIADPPGVSGWPAYYQEPIFHEAWLTTDTYAKRMEFLNTLSENGFYIDGTYRLRANYVTYVSTFDNPEDPNLLIDEAIYLLYTFEVSPAFKDYLKSFLLSGQASDYYWTDAWYNYTGNPTTANYNIVNTRLKGMFKYLLSQAEYQIC